MNHQEYYDRLAGIFEGPKNAGIDEDVRQKMLQELIAQMPEDNKPLAVKSSFGSYVLDEEELKFHAYEYNRDERFEGECELHWESRNTDMVSKLETGTALLHFAKDLKSEAVKEAEKLLDEGAELAERLGVSLSDHKVSFRFGSAEQAKRMARNFSDIEEELVTVDIRISPEDPKKVSFYGSKKEIEELMEDVMNYDFDDPLGTDISFIEKTKPRVPGYIDGDSYQIRKGNRLSFQQKMSRDAQSEGPSAP